MNDDTLRTEPAAPQANGIRTWVRRNGGALVLAAVLVAWFQYHSANTERLIGQIGERIESLEDNQKIVAEQLGARMTSLENSNGARMNGIEADVRELRAVLRDVLERLIRIEVRLDGSAPEPAVEPGEPELPED